MRSTNTLPPDVRRRLARLIITACAVFLCGLGYAALCLALGTAIPCLFYSATGFLCPGCGVTRMCLSLLRLDVRTAWQLNPGLFLLLPVLAAAALRLAFRYVKTGSLRPGRAMNLVLWACVVWLLTWGVLRNVCT